MVDEDFLAKDRNLINKVLSKSHEHIPLIVIVGPTASGKSELATDIALRFNGEIICADSRTVYKGMDVATAKPTLLEQKTIRHWGLDLVAPNECFSVVDFKEYADKKIDEIKSRGHIPLLVGGTGLYIDAVLFGYQFGGLVDKELQTKLQQLSIEELHGYCTEHGINLPENNQNKRYVIRSIENAGVKKHLEIVPKYKNIVVGITTDKICLRKRIEERIEHQLENGVIDEAISLSNKYGWNHESMKSNIYQSIHLYINGALTFDELHDKAVVSDWRLAKRQLTWLKRNSFIQWFNIHDANKYLAEQLAIQE